MSKTKVISFRLSNEEIESFSKGLSVAKNQSVFFKELVLNKSSFEATKKLIAGTDEYAKFNFLLSKVSNNINQIAKVLNILSNSNFTDRAALNKALNNLHALEVTLKSKLL